jgi:hypothetical protein
MIHEIKKEREREREKERVFRGQKSIGVHGLLAGQISAEFRLERTLDLELG